MRALESARNVVEQSSASSVKMFAGGVRRLQETVDRLNKLHHVIRKEYRAAISIDKKQAFACTLFHIEEMIDSIERGE